MKQRVTYANVTATIALFIALGGVGYAAGRINGSNIKNRSIPGTKLKKHSVTGKEINLGKLGQVPSAANSDQLGGVPASSYVKNTVPAAPIAVAPASGVNNCPGRTGEFCSRVPSGFGFPFAWSNFGAPYEPATYLRDMQGIVHLVGTLQWTAGGTPDSECNPAHTGPMFVLPKGFRPAGQQIFSVMTTGNVVGRLDVLSDGSVECMSGGSPSPDPNSYISLAGISFRAAG